MSIKISLIISVMGFFMLLLTIARAEALYRTKYGDFKAKRVPLILWVRMVIMFLIPLFNILLLSVFVWCFLFANEEWYEESVFNDLKKQ